MVKQITAKGSYKLALAISYPCCPHFFNIVSHHWTGSYLLKRYGAHYRKFLRITSKIISISSSDWTGDNVWGSPIVSNAPPLISHKI